MSKSKVKPIRSDQIAFRPKQFASACGFSRTTLYALPEEQRPRSVKVGHARVIVETPAAWLQRLAQMQQVAA
jgi:predicted DNA-binding transcriptional regulator AlpA